MLTMSGSGARRAEGRAARPRAKRPGRHAVVPAAEVSRMIDECTEDLATTLGFRPIVHAGWPAEESLPAPVAEAVLEAVDAALLEVHAHDRATTAIVAIELGTQSVEVCVVDNGWYPTGRRIGELVVDEPNGVERGVEEYEGYGTCQWWSIPFDVL